MLLGCCHCDEESTPPSDSTPPSESGQSQSGSSASELSFDVFPPFICMCDVVPVRWTSTLTGWDRKTLWTAHGPCCQSMNGTYTLIRNLTPPAFENPAGYITCVEWRSAEATHDGSTLQAVTPPCGDVINARRKVYCHLAVDDPSRSIWRLFITVWHMGFVNTFNSSVFWTSPILTGNSSTCLYPSFTLRVDGHQQCNAGSVSVVPG
jgi:hypothetical protein